MVSSQIKFIEMLAKKVVSLNFYQIEYVFKKYTEKEKNKNNTDNFIQTYSCKLNRRKIIN